MKRRPPLFQPYPGQYWPIVRWHAQTVYMAVLIYGVINFLEWLL